MVYRAWDTTGESNATVKLIHAFYTSISYMYVGSLLFNRGGFYGAMVMLQITSY